eukprot:g9534.t1
MVSASTKVPGVRVKGSKWVYDYPKVGLQTSANDSAHLEVHPVAKYKTEVSYTVGSLLAANSKFICYALKNDKGIRVIDRRNPSVRALLKGHTAPVSDIRLFCNQNQSEEYLALASKDGSIFVWKLVGSGDNIECENIFKMYHPLAGGNGAIFRKIAWHPYDKNVLAAVEGRYLLCMNIEKVNTNGIKTGDENSLKDAGITVIEGHIAPIGDLKWSSDGAQIVTASDDGKVKLWDLMSQSMLYEFEPDDGRPVSSVHIVPNKNSGIHSLLNATLIVGCERDGIMSIWSSANSGGQLLQTVTIMAEPQGYESGEPEPLFSQVYNNALYDEETRLLFVSSTRRPNRDESDSIGEDANLCASLLVLHFNDSSLQFDRLTEFECQMPVVSMTLPATYEGTPGVEDEHRLYQRTLFCVQSKAVQQYQIWPHECYVPDMQPQERETKNVQHRPKDGTRQYVANGRQEADEALLSPTAFSNQQQSSKQIYTGQQTAVEQRQPDFPGKSIPVDTLFLDAKNNQGNTQSKNEGISNESAVDAGEITKAVVEGLTAAIPNEMANTFRNSFKSLLLPAFDNACKEMFNQVRNEVRKSLDADKKREKKLENQVAQLSSQVKALTKMVESLRSTVSSPKVSKQGEGKSADNTSKVSKKTSLSPKEKALLAYEKNDYQMAFWTVLSAANLNLVEWLCEHANSEAPETVVSKLTQMVILSLAQQLGSNLKTKTKLKLAWIKAACLSLDTSDESIKNHIPKVLGNVQESLKKHFTILKIDTNSQHPLRTEYVMVTHLVKSLSMTH